MPVATGGAPTGTVPGATSSPDSEDPVLPPGAFTPTLDGAPIHARLVRITHEQWENSVRDLLGLSERSGLSDGFEGDPPRGTFDNNERALEVTSTLWGDYERAAETLAETASVDDAARQRMSSGLTGVDFVRDFGRRAFRRPLTADEESTYLALHDAAATYFPELDASVAGLRLTVEAMLQSPHFIYRSELGADGEPLSSYEVASKLSFLLRNTTPNDELLDAAEAGELTTADSVSSWATRMLDEDGARQVIASYNTTLLGTNRFSSITKDTGVFPSFDLDTSLDMQAEADEFLSRIFEDGLGVRDLITSRKAFVTSRTAGYYGETAPTGSGLMEVELGEDRPGFFTRLGFLAFNGNNAQSDPIHRGVELNLRMLCISLTAPPGELPALPAQEDDQTNRERVAITTEVPGTPCEACHKTLINPLGYAFESFDAIGQLRTTDNGQPIDTASAYQFSDGLKSFAGASELMNLLAESEQVHSCLAKNLTEFTLGRDLSDEDLSLVMQVADGSLTGSSSMKSMMLEAVVSDAFLTRTGVVQ